MGKLDNEILAVKAVDIQTLLDSIIANGGFIPFESEEQYLELLEHSVTGIRGELENDPSFKQIIPYMVAKHEGMVFYYFRAAGGGETRLHGKMSIGLGGHIELEDIEAAEETIKKALTREVREELGQDQDPISINPLGYIYVEEGGVDDVHIGILFVGELASKNINPSKDELRDGEFVDPKTLTNYIADSEHNAENWTKVSWENAKELIIEG